MAKRTNRFRVEADRTPKRRAFWRGPRSTAGRRSRGARRLEIGLLVALAAAIVVGLGALGFAAYAAKSNQDWASVASVNGSSISREALRGRIAVLGLLAQQRATVATQQAAAGRMTADQGVALKARAEAPLADPVNSARESLIAEELLRQLAARDGVATPAAPDAWAEATAYVAGDVAHRIRLVRIEVPADKAAADATAATATIKSQLAAGTPVETIVAGLHDAGWTVFGEDVYVSSTGVAADPALDLDPSIAAAALGGRVGQVVGPATDTYGRVSLAAIVTGYSTTDRTRLIAAAGEAAKVDSGAVQSWANGQALRRAVADSLLARWRTTPLAQAHFRELVVGPATTAGSSGKWVQLSHLVLSRLTGPNADAAALTARLAAMSIPDRVALFRSLVDEANGGPAPDPISRSGEMAFVTKDGLLPELGKVAFDDKARSGDVIGPIVTSAGPELFLIESRYDGPLDERAQRAIATVRSDPMANPLTYTTRFSPADVALARDAGWRTEAEFATDDQARAALFDTPAGFLSDPFVLDGRLALAVVSERKTALPDSRALDRLSLSGFDAWLHSESLQATITRADNPLPELVPSPSASPTNALSTEPAMHTPEIPQVPQMPGQSAATPALP